MVRTSNIKASIRVGTYNVSDGDFFLNLFKRNTTIYLNGTNKIFKVICYELSDSRHYIRIMSNDKNYHRTLTFLNRLEFEILFHL